MHVFESLFKSEKLTGKSKGGATTIKTVAKTQHQR